MGRRIEQTLEAVVALLMALMCATVAVGVFHRYVLVNPLGWTEEVARFCLVWITFLAAPLALRRGQHMQMDLLYARLPRGARRPADMFGLTVLLAFSAVLLVFGLRYATAMMGSRTPYLDLPQGVVYLGLPAGAALFIWAALGSPRARGEGREGGARSRE